MERDIRHEKKNVGRLAGLAVAVAAKLAGAGALLSVLVLGGLIYERDWATGKEVRLRHVLVTPEEHDFEMLDQLVDHTDKPDFDEPQLKGILSRELRIGVNTRVLVLDRHTGSNKAKVRILEGSYQGRTGWVFKDEIRGESALETLVRRVSSLTFSLLVLLVFLALIARKKPLEET